VTLLLLAGAATGSAATAGHVTAEVLSDAVRVGGGAPMRVGVRFRIDPGWHIYWSNPGDAGLATAVDLDLPAGWKAGPLQWPTPKRFEQPGGLLDYGYENEVVLIREVRPPRGAEAPVTVPVTASWLACREVCVLGESRLRLSLPPSPSDAESAGPVLDAWARRVPTCGGPTDPWEATVRGSRDDLTIWLRWRTPPGSVAWFPEALESATVHGGDAVTRGGLTRIDLTLRPVAGHAPPRSLPSVVAWTDDAGARHARCLEVELGAVPPDDTDP